MPEIYLARHGQDLDNLEGILNGHRDRPLTDLGVQQAWTLMLNIRDIGLTFDAVYSSPLQRAYATAEVVTDGLGLAKPVVMSGLIERNFGIMTGKLTKDVVSLCAPDIICANPITYFLSPEGAETFPQLIERGRRVIADVQNQHKDGRVLLVAHGDIGKMIYAAYYHLEWQSVLTMFHFGNSELLLLSGDSLPEAAHVFQCKQYNH